MSDENDFEPSNLQEDQDPSLLKTGVEPENTPKKKSNTLFIIFISVFALIAVVLAYFMFMPSSTKTKKVSAPKEVEKKLTEEQLSSEQPVQSAPTVGNEQPNPFGENQPLPEQPQGQPQGQQSPVGNTLPNLDATPSLPNSSDVPASLTDKSNQPVPSMEQPSPVVDPSVSHNQPVLSQQEIPTSSSTTDPLNQFKDMLAPIDGRVGVLENKVGKLENTVGDLVKKVDGRFSSKPAQKTTVKKVQHETHSNAIKVQKVYRPKRKENVAPNKVSHVIVEGFESQYQPVRPSLAVVPSSVRNLNVPSANSTQNDLSDLPKNCSIQAIVKGRVWIKHTDGSFSSYSEGDKFYGHSIDEISPQKGIRLGDKWICQ